ncbi:NTP/NDP exchange transporter [Anaeromyxobacter diazotrophicus]|uniref:MFS transporter n=1 Tax=Anaeromyxobacter diazotrophicus TaxID=2590199 RepID=A0A7I9VKK3_9BACT|nr:MFS transporter [Anaeromyxobacter diazotrophicus]GEJ56537.1 MFS transporter [Anaeromyxobacter diazotrophicus]
MSGARVPPEGDAAGAPARAGLLRRAVDVRAGELGALALSFAYFFALLCGYYVLRPIRDEMGISRGVDKLPVLFTGTFVAMAVASPLFGWLASRWPRHRLITWAYHFFALDLVLFCALWKLELGKGWVPFAFYVWAAVYNLFVTSVFWSFMTDVFTSEQGKRLFGFISAGGGLGALAGPLVTSWLARPLGGANLLLASALLLEVSVACVVLLERWARAGAARRGAAATADREQAVGGTVWSGIRPVLASPYLLASALYILLLTVANTFLYFQQAHLVAAATSDRGARTALFARIDLVVNVCTLLLQTLVTGQVLKRLGVAVGLGIAPALTAAGYAVLGVSPALVVLAPFQGLRRAAQYAILRPSRELLFTVVSREERYKSKNFIDTVVFRGGDMLSGWLYAGLAGLGLGVAGTSWVSVPLSLVWLALGVYLGREQRRRAGAAG